MIQDIKDEVLDTSLQPDNNPRYTIKDNNGRIINDNAQIYLKTPVIQAPTPLNRATLANIQGDLYTQDRYSTPAYSGTIMTLDLPLTSYETGKIVNIIAPATLTNPTININKLGAKTVNGEIKAGEKYNLIYNGSSWDFIKPYKVIKGSYTGTATDSTLKTQTIDLGATPKAVLVYASKYRYSMVAVEEGYFGSNYHATLSSDTHDPDVLAYSSDYGYISITENGFDAYGPKAYGYNSSSITYYYIAIF